MNDPKNLKAFDPATIGVTLSEWVKPVENQRTMHRGFFVKFGEQEYQGKKSTVLVFLEDGSEKKLSSPAGLVAQLKKMEESGYIYPGAVVAFGFTGKKKALTGGRTAWEYTILQDEKNPYIQATPEQKSEALKNIDDFPF